MTSELPARPSLEQIKKQAKDLHGAHAGHLPSCLSVLRHLHRFKDSTDQAVFASDLKLADVQFALAMEYGFSTWEALLQHLEDRALGLGEHTARAWARVRKNGTLAGIIGGEPKSVTDVSKLGFTILEVEGLNGVFVVEETEPGGATQRLIQMQRLGEFLNAAGVQAPRITLLEVDGRTVGVHQKVVGESVENIKLSDAERERYVNEVAGLLGRMHAVPLADALRILGLPAMTPEKAAQHFRFGQYLEVDVIESKLAAELDADQDLNKVWHETRAWITTFVSTPADLVFGHGDLWEDYALVTRTADGYRLSGVNGLYNGGLMNLYDEFLRVASLGRYLGEGESIGRAIIETYNRLPGSRRVEEVPLRHAIAAFWFYLAADPGQTAEKRKAYCTNAKQTLRGK